MDISNFDRKKLRAALEAAAGQGRDPQSLHRAADAGDLDGVLASLRPEDAAELKRLLADRAATQKILSSPQAQQLLKTLRKDGRA